MVRGSGRGFGRANNRRLVVGVKDRPLFRNGTGGALGIINSIVVAARIAVKMKETGECLLIAVIGPIQAKYPISRNA